jgi:hypothetical protein
MLPTMSRRLRETSRVRSSFKAGMLLAFQSLWYHCRNLHISFQR